MVTFAKSIDMFQYWIFEKHDWDINDLELLHHIIHFRDVFSVFVMTKEENNGLGAGIMVEVIFNKRKMYDELLKFDLPFVIHPETAGEIKKLYQFKNFISGTKTPATWNYFGLVWKVQFYWSIDKYLYPLGYKDPFNSYIHYEV
jgi:hypothetical protein